MKLSIFSIKQYGVLFLSLMTFSLYAAPNCVQVTFVSKTASTATFSFDLMGTGTVTDYTIIVKSGASLVGDFRYSSSTAVALSRSLGAVTVNTTNPATVNFTLSTSEVLDLDGNEYIPPICAVALPVELLSFQGQNQGKTNLLTWQTASEKNNYGFQVQRSAEGKDFEPLIFASGHGTTNEKQSYSYIDNSPFITTYYRLRQIDFDGKESFSKTISLVRLVVKNLKIYPTPATDYLSVETDETGNFSIINLLGQTMMHSQITNSVDISTLPSAVYFFRVGQEQIKFLKL